MSASISILNDANPKVVLLGFECLQTLVTDFGEHFTPLINMSFDVLLAKFGDSKVRLLAVIAGRVVPDIFCALSFPAAGSDPAEGLRDDAVPSGSYGSRRGGGQTHGERATPPL